MMSFTTSTVFRLFLVSLCNESIESFTPTTNNFSTIPSSDLKPSHLHANLITFDLDDTIFPVGPVVHDANVALMDHLASLNAPTTQSDFIASTKFIRSELAKDGRKITYTELRKRTIQREMERLVPSEEQNNGAITKEVVSNAYELWEEHRHMAAERHLYHDTIDMLDELKESFPDATIAAITNGKGNPLKMKNTVEKYFDYCISGEDDNVFPYRKPDAGIYKVAIEKYQELNSIKDGEDFCWIHVGDDLANDVGASAQCGAKSIWVDLDEEQYNQTASSKTSKTGSSKKEEQPVWSTATKEEQEMRRILNEKAQRYVAARVQTLAELPEVVRNISSGVQI